MSFYPCVTNKAPYTKCVIKGTLYNGVSGTWENEMAGTHGSIPEGSTTYNWTITLNLETGTYSSSGFNSKRSYKGSSYSFPAAYGGIWDVIFIGTANITITSVTFS